MMVHGRDHEQWRNNLGLSLSLGIGAADDEPPCRAPSVAPPVSSAAPPPPRCWDDSGAMHAGRRMDVGEMPLLRGIDVNRGPAAAAPVSTTSARRASCSEEEDEEDPGASSPNSTLSSLSAGKRGAPTGRSAPAGGGSDDEDDSSPGGSRKKLRLSKDQAAVLEDTFKDHNTLNPKQKAALARQLKLKARQVEVWFQNRRARTKLKQTEVDCELLKRCCETLTDENRRLHKELHDLRALSLYARMPPPPSTTLTICPSCDRNAAAGVGVGGRSPARPAPTRPWAHAPIRPLFADRPAQRT